MMKYVKKKILMAQSPFPYDFFRDTRQILDERKTHQNLNKDEDKLLAKLEAAARKWVEVNQSDKKLAESTPSLTLEKEYLDPSFVDAVFGALHPPDDQKGHILVSKQICDLLFEIAERRQRRRRLLGIYHPRTHGYQQADSFQDLLCYPHWNVSQTKRQMEFDKKRAAGQVRGLREIL